MSHHKKDFRWSRLSGSTKRLIERIVESWTSGRAMKRRRTSGEKFYSSFQARGGE
jgi:hypothetical protein